MIVELVRVVAGLILILFIPGFALTWAFFPRKGDIDRRERVALSFALSIAGVMLSVLFIDMALGLDTTPPNIIISLVSLTLLSLFIWKAHLYIIDNNLKRTIIKRASDYRGRFMRTIKLRRYA